MFFVLMNFPKLINTMVIIAHTTVPMKKPLTKQTITRAKELKLIGINLEV